MTAMHRNPWPRNRIPSRLALWVPGLVLALTALALAAEPPTAPPVSGRSPSGLPAGPAPGGPPAAVHRGPDGRLVPVRYGASRAQTRPELGAARAAQAGPPRENRARAGEAVAQGPRARTPFGAKGERAGIAFGSGFFVPPAGVKLQPALRRLAALRAARPGPLGARTGGRAGAAVEEAGKAAVDGFIVLHGRLDEPLQARFDMLGVRLFGFYPDTAYRARLPVASIAAVASLPQVRWVGQPEPFQKLAPELQPLLAAVGATAPQAVYVHFFGPDTGGQAQAAIAAAGAQLGRYEPALNAVLARLDAAALRGALALDSVLYVEPVVQFRTHHGQSMASINADWLWGVFDPSPSVQVKVGLVDSGCYMEHADFERIKWNTLGYNHVPGENWFIDLDGHGTHVSGTLLGAGAGDSRFRGVAAGLHGHGDAYPNPDYLVAQVADRTGGGETPEILAGLTSMAGEWPGSPPGLKRQVFNMSLGSGGIIGRKGTDVASIRVDDLFRKNILPVVSAGNAGPEAGTIGAPGVAKGALTVGAVCDVDFSMSATIGGERVNRVGHADGMADYSSRGPTGDDRVKPDVVAPGSLIDSCSSGTWNGYRYGWSGTSMSAPHVTGLAAGLIAHYGMPAWATKSAILASAIDLGFPATDQGRGKVDALLAHSDVDGGWETHWSTNGGSGDLKYFDFNLEAAAAQLKLVFVYPDAPAAPGAVKALKNDLDIWLDHAPFVDGRGGEWYSRSSVDNVEVITVNNAPAGTYRIKVDTWAQVEGATQDWAVTLKWVRGSTQPNVTQTLEMPHAVQPDTAFTARGSATAGSYVASGVRGVLVLGEALSFVGAWYNRRSRPSTGDEWFWYPHPCTAVYDERFNWNGTFYQVHRMLHGSIGAGYTRTIEWVVRAGPTEGVQDLSYAVQSRNGGSGTVTRPVIIDGTSPFFLGGAAASDWGAGYAPDVTCQAQDLSAGVNPGNAWYRYSIDAGASWSSWSPASCTGTFGSTAVEAVTAADVPFGTADPQRNRIQFYVADTAGNPAASGPLVVSPNTGIRLAASDFSGSEAAAAVEVTVTRTGDLSLISTVDYATSDGSATAGTDYTAAAGTITFSLGESSKTLHIGISADQFLEGTELFHLSIAGPTGGVLGGPASAALTIDDDLARPAPSHLEAAVAGPTSALLTWRDECANEASFNLERSGDGGATWTSIGVPASAGTGAVVTVTDAGLTPEASYLYRVQAVGPAGGPSSEFSAIAEVNLAVPAPPSALSASPRSRERIKVTFQDESTNETGFTLERSTDPAFPSGGTTAFTLAAKAGTGSRLNHTSTGLSPDTTYFFRVRATNSVGNSPWVGPVSAET